MNVEIDGVRYVPDASIKNVDDEKIVECVREMTVARVLYGAPHGCRSEKGAWWAVLTLLAGEEFRGLLWEDPDAAATSISAFPADKGGNQ
jgi:hypothetical protein